MGWAHSCAVTLRFGSPASHAAHSEIRQAQFSSTDCPRLLSSSPAAALSEKELAGRWRLDERVSEGGRGEVEKGESGSVATHGVLLSALFTVSPVASSPSRALVLSSPVE